jgi:hypothetical protein
VQQAGVTVNVTTTGDFSEKDSKHYTKSQHIKFDRMIVSLKTKQK